MTELEKAHNACWRAGLTEEQIKARLDHEPPKDGGKAEREEAEAFYAENPFTPDDIFNWDLEDGHENPDDYTVCPYWVEKHWEEVMQMVASGEKLQPVDRYFMVLWKKFRP